MAEIKVRVLDKKTLEILEDAKPGDRIDLSTITTIDEDYINEIINNAKNDVTAQRIKEKEEQFKKEIEALEEKYAMSNKFALQDEQKKSEHTLSELKSQYEQKINSANENTSKLQAEINTLRATNDSDLKLKLNEEANKIKEHYDKLIADLNSQLSIMKSEAKLTLNEETNKVKEHYEKVIADLNVQLNKINSEFKVQQELNNTKVEALKSDLQSKFTSELSKANEEKNKVLMELDNMKLQKSYQSVKMIGESLEKWCNEEYQNAQLCGFEHCTWEKDNDAIKDDLDSTDKASKADYIFKMYTNDVYSKVNEITSVCLEMKSESPNSTNKRTNESYAKRLDANRKKKECEYALLVSELERTEDNDAPIKKMTGYDKMYMVRPQYMITFLSIVYSLGKRYRDLILSIKENDEELREIIDINNQFENFKETYVIKPIESLAKQCETMRKKASLIIDAANDINSEVDIITSKTIQNILTKIETFTIKKDKLNKKIAKLEK